MTTDSYPMNSINGYEYYIGLYKCYHMVDCATYKGVEMWLTTPMDERYDIISYRHETNLTTWVYRIHEENEYNRISWNIPRSSDTISDITFKYDTTKKLQFKVTKTHNINMYNNMHDIDFTVDYQFNLKNYLAGESIQILVPHEYNIDDVINELVICYTCYLYKRKYFEELYKSPSRLDMNQFGMNKEIFQVKNIPFYDLVL